VLQALSPELALMFLPQPRGEFVVRPAITAHDTLTHSTGFTIGLWMSAIGGKVDKADAHYLLSRSVDDGPHIIRKSMS
jgi:hypothetical protein